MLRALAPPSSQDSNSNMVCPPRLALSKSLAETEFPLLTADTGLGQAEQVLVAGHRTRRVHITRPIILLGSNEGSVR